ncbi:hypothetical protein [Flaviaesturariibacter amylovorans]|uniref:DUF1311 domain-containing protein n=1 Tax=Flaviaesturariibacter amylovorans TaxID=1084520 RepID=A0ABP8HIW5_9BACT
MKKILFLLLASGICGASYGQDRTTVGTSTGSYPAKSSCQNQVNAINHSYNKQVTAHKTNSKLTAVDREYKILMTNLYRNEKLSQVEQSCGATTFRYRSCVESANAIVASAERQKETFRTDTRYTTRQQSEKIASTNEDRNEKLRELLASCKY